MSEARNIASGARISTSAMRSAFGGRMFAALSVVGLSWWYFAAHRRPSADHYHGLVTALGWISMVLSMLAVALSVRKRLAYQGIAKLSGWFTFHIYVGIIAAFAVLYHSSFRAGGPLTAWLLAFFALTVASGVVGLWISRRFPPLLTAIEENPAIIEELLVTRAECLRGMLELAGSGSDDFRILVEKRLLKQTASWKRILRFYRNRSKLAQELPAFLEEHESDVRRLKPHEQRAFQRAADYALRVNKMSAELFLQRVMRSWLTLHVVSTAAMLVLAVIHTISVLYY